jgi:hypothetical protein
MGNTQKTHVRVGSSRFEAEALLETSELIIRGEKRIRIPFGEMKALAAKDGALTFRFRDEAIAVDLGANAEKWLEKIRNPKSVIEKLGVKSGHGVVLVNIRDEAFARDLESRGATTVKKNADAIFYGANTRADLARVAKLRESLAQNGALWIIRPKGVKEITESDVRTAGKAAGLVDVKVVRFSDTHTAEKFVIPVSLRR